MVPLQSAKILTFLWYVNGGWASGDCVATILWPFQGYVTCHFSPTACAVGCILAPLRGCWVGLRPEEG